MAATDNPLKQLVEAFAEDFAAWLLKAEVREVHTLNVELLASPTRVDQLLLFCYHYDPATGKYAVVMKTMRIAGVVTVAGIFGLLFFLSRITKLQARAHAGVI